MSGEEVRFYDWQVRSDFPYDWLEQQDFVNTPNAPTDPAESQKLQQGRLKEVSNVISISSHPDFRLNRSSNEISHQSPA